MRSAIFSPCDALKPYIKHFIISENETAQTYKVLPGTSLVMGFQYSGKLAHVQSQQDVPLAKTGITGLMDNYRLFKNSINTGSVLVIFHETGVAAFLRSPVNELFNESTSLDNFFSTTELAETEEQLCAANNDQKKIQVIEQLLLRHLQPATQDKMVEKAIEYIHKSKGTIRMAALASQLYTSQSPLEKRFRKVVGASPKKFSSIVRIQNVRSLLAQHNYHQAMYLAAYYDQAHFIKDLKKFTGETPEQYLRPASDKDLK